MGDFGFSLDVEVLLCRDMVSLCAICGSRSAGRLRAGFRSWRPASEYLSDVTSYLAMSEVYRETTARSNSIQVILS